MNYTQTHARLETLADELHPTKLRGNFFHPEGVKDLFEMFARTRKEILTDCPELSMDIPEIIMQVSNTTDFDGAGYVTKGQLNSLFQITQRALKLYEAATASSRTLSSPNVNGEPNELIKLLISKFHIIAKQLTRRHGKRPSIIISDEYDVQDLFHALLKIFFDDVRPEEYTPSYAGSSSRMDFLLKNERIVVELKMARDGLDGKEIGNQLIQDIAKYQAHPDCDVLFCFVYDPENRIINPRGLESDLSGQKDNLLVTMLIVP